MLQTPGADASPTTLQSAASHHNGPTDSSPLLVPSRAGGGASPASAGNPFVTAAAAPATGSASDPFAKLASGLLGATPPSHQPGKRKTDRSCS